jgi:hypothetical protein
MFPFWLSGQKKAISFDPISSILPFILRTHYVVALCWDLYLFHRSYRMIQDTICKTGIPQVSSLCILLPHSFPQREKEKQSPYVYCKIPWAHLGCCFFLQPCPISKKTHSALHIKSYLINSLRLPFLAGVHSKIWHGSNMAYHSIFKGRGHSVFIFYLFILLLFFFRVNINALDFLLVKMGLFLHFLPRLSSNCNNKAWN